MKADSVDVNEEPRYRLRWLATIDPSIDRPCMTAPMPLLTRLAHQVTGRTVIRDCCQYHGMDWHQASAIAVTLARRLRREHITDYNELSDRVFDLINGLDGDLRRAVLSLLSPGVGIKVARLGEDPRHPRHWTYQDGRHRTRAMPEAGVRRTVVVYWQEVPDAKWAASIDRWLYGLTGLTPARIASRYRTG